jgi:NAD(P)H dehydrogenase (quinone)
LKNILVFGANGAQARPVAEQLAARGYRVTAMVRDGAKAASLAHAGIRVVIGDMDDADAVAKAMNGQDGVFMLVSFAQGRTEQARTIIEAAKAHGVGRIVWNATGSILPVDIGNPAIDMRRAILAALEQSGVPFVALQPTIYMENLLMPVVAEEVAHRDSLPYPLPDAVKCQWISHADAAAFVVAAFERKTRENLVIDICGPERLSGSEIAARFSRALGRPIAYRAMPPAEFGATLPFGESRHMVTKYYEEIAADLTKATTNVDFGHALALLPIEPTSMEQFARTYATMFTLADEPAQATARA